MVSHGLCRAVLGVAGPLPPNGARITFIRGAGNTFVGLAMAVMDGTERALYDSMTAAVVQSLSDPRTYARRGQLATLCTQIAEALGWEPLTASETAAIGAMRGDKTPSGASS